MSDDVDEALRRARQHLRQATIEGLEATRALLAAAMRSAGLEGATRDSLTGEIQKSLEELLEALRSNAFFALPKAVALPIIQALDSEIARWEHRSETDADARPVLRAFLALRELLWEVGVRREDEKSAAPPRQPESSPDPERESPDEPLDKPPGRIRVQRFDVE